MKVVEFSAGSYNALRTSDEAIWLDKSEFILFGTVLFAVELNVPS